MSGFNFDTGAKDAGPRFIDAWECAVRDRLPHDHTERDYHAEAVRELTNEIWGRKKPETIRKRFWSQMFLIKAMSEDSPDLHDKLIEEFCERLAMFAGTPEESGETAHNAHKPTNPTNPTNGETYNGF